MTPMNRIVGAVAGVLALLALPGLAAVRVAAERPALEKIRTDTGNELAVVMNPATATPRLLRLRAGALHLDGGTTKARANDFLRRYGEAFGIEDPTRELEETASREDALGMTHVSFRQIYKGVPVFASDLRLHFNEHDDLVTVNGTFVPDITIDPSPTLGAAEASGIARALVAKEHGLRRSELDGGRPQLYVFRGGLVRGVPGANHLVWEVEVTYEQTVREFLYIDAHNGNLIDRIQGIHELERRVHHHTTATTLWQEGDPLPFTDLGEPGDTEVNNLIEVTRQTYELFANLTGGSFLSYNGSDIAMRSVYDSNSLEQCPNAQWNGFTTNFCTGIAIDDVIAHEWTHAYSGSTHRLIYQWQPGALNESYSDIFGEIVDRLNGAGPGEPDSARMDGGCSTVGGQFSPTLTISAPAQVAGDYAVRDAVFNPLPPWSLSAQVELVNDGVADGDNTLSDACDPPLVDFTPGRIALIDRGICLFRDKVAVAQNAGASGVIVVNNQGDQTIRMGGDPPRLGIPALFLGQSDGAALKAVLDQDVQATFSQEAASDPSAGWLVAEDSSAGAFRDMWNPACFSDPGRVSDAQYFCDEGDNGGVHTNSSIPNHAFALLVDGGTFNGYTVTGIGITKATHVYWRAMSTYQVPTTDLADHADLLELSCSDLERTGEPLADLLTGETSPEVVDTFDCDQVTQAMLAVEMRSEPTQCNFAPVLAPNPPRVAANQIVFSEGFDTDPMWSASSEGVFEEFDGRLWQFSSNPPPGGDGGAAFAIDSSFIGNCRPGNNDQSGVLHLDSPAITIPSTASTAVLVFDHFVATEPGWDGGNLRISVNGGAFTLVPIDSFLFNPYNDQIIDVLGDDQNANPLAGEPGFSGTDEGQLVGSWGQSQVDLGTLANPGDTIQLRFAFGTDGCGGNEGWYVDNVKVLVGGVGLRESGRRVRP